MAVVLASTAADRHSPLFRPANGSAAFILPDQLFPGADLPGTILCSLARGQSRSAMVVMILLISLVPVALPAMFNLRLPEAPLANIEGMVLRQMPVLLIGVVLVATRYSLYLLLGYLGVVYLLELSIVIFSHSLIHNQMHAYLFTTLIRTVSFFLVGAFINQLVIIMRAQQRSLAAANRKLANYTTALEELTISRERNRVSRELHDTVVHSLSGLLSNLKRSKHIRGGIKRLQTNWLTRLWHPPTADYQKPGAR